MRDTLEFLPTAPSREANVVVREREGESDSEFESLLSS